jgi:hypothetical protein
VTRALQRGGGILQLQAGAIEAGDDRLEHAARRSEHPLDRALRAAQALLGAARSAH